MDKVHKAWDTFQTLTNEDMPQARHVYDSMSDDLGNISHGGGGGGGGGSGDLGPWFVPKHDGILSSAIKAASAVQRGGQHSVRIFEGDPGSITVQSTKRPSRAPSWAWGDTTTSPENMWINPDIGDAKQVYTIPHEWAHTIDDRFFNGAIRLAIMVQMGLVIHGWSSGHYDEHYSTVPMEGFADSFARAITGGGFGSILPGFYRSHIKPADYGWLLRVVEEAMGI